MRIGIFGGSFDPIHNGHAMVANYASQWLGLDEVWLMVSPLNPLKSGSRPAADFHRLAMARLVAEDCRGVKVSDFEFSRPVPSYTYSTLCALRTQYPENSFSLIIGSDNWLDFSRWRDHEKIIEEFGLYIYLRPDYPIEASLPENVRLMRNAPQAQISSTFVREAVKVGRNLNFFLPLKVFEYIMKNNLYR